MVLMVVSLIHQLSLFHFSFESLNFSDVRHKENYSLSVSDAVDFSERCSEEVIF